MEWDWSPLSEEQMGVYRELCPPGEYRVLETGIILPGVSVGLQSKISRVLIAASGDSEGKFYYMANLHRPDPKDPAGPAVDQMPFGFVFDSKVPMLSGALIQHGEWEGRTTYPPPSAWNEVVDGDYEAFLNLKLLPPLTSGTIFELMSSAPSQHRGFSTLISGLSTQAAIYERSQTQTPPFDPFRSR